MNFILCLLIVAYLCALGVNCRSVQIDSDSRSADKDGNHDTQSSGIFSWIRLKPLLRREVQRISSVKGETNKFNQGSTETESLAPSKENENLLSEKEVLNTNEKNSSKAESPITNTSIIKSELVEQNHNEDPNIESNMIGEINSNTTDVQMHEMNHPLIANDFPDNVISDILNQSGDSIFLQALDDNSSNLDSIEFDETSLLSEGGHIAMLQEVSTIGFELLIDSETKQNSIIAELLNSQSNLIDDDDDVNDEDISFVTMHFNHSNENELQETITDIKQTSNPDVEFSTDKEETEKNEFGSDDGKTGSTKFGSDEERTEDSEFGSDEGKTESSQFGSDEGKTEGGKFGSDEGKTQSTKFGSDEERTEDSEFGSEEDKTESSQFGSDGSKTEGGNFGSDEDKTKDGEFGSDDGKTENGEIGSDEGKAEDGEIGSDEGKTEDGEFGSDEGKTEDGEFGSDEGKAEDGEIGSDEGKAEDDKIGSDGGKAEDGEIGSDEGKAEDGEFGSDDNKTENSKIGSDEGVTENTGFDTGEIKNVHNESELSDSVQDKNVTEISNIEPEDPRCPDPGWCIFWFMGIDLCAKDSHCHGSLLCCTIGCSKTCIDADNDFL